MDPLGIDPWFPIVGSGTLTCLCCVWCLRSKGAKPRAPLSIILAAVNFLLVFLYCCLPLSRSIDFIGLERTLKSMFQFGGTSYAPAEFLCLLSTILAWRAIFLYQKKQNDTFK